MAKVPFGSCPDDAPGPRAHPRGRTRRPLRRAYRCPATVPRPRTTEASIERYRGFVALHSALSAGPEIRVGRLWAGGMIAATCAALMALVGTLVSRGVWDVSVPVPVSPRIDGPAVGAAYALCVGALTLQATGLLHVLMVVSPRPVNALTWICGPVTGIATVVPLVLGGGLDARIATSVINLATGLVAIALLAVTASVSARWPGPPGLDPRL